MKTKEDSSGCRQFSKLVNKGCNLINLCAILVTMFHPVFVRKYLLILGSSASVGAGIIGEGF